VPSGRDDGAVKRSTTIRHLVEMAEVATERIRLRETDIGWPLEEMWVTGELLSFADTLEAGAVVLVLDLPAEDLPWLALHPAGEWVGDQLRLGKRPLRWSYRPLTWPVWNHEHRRLVRFWSAAGGLDLAVVEALRSRSLDRVTVIEPSVDQLAEQLREELAVSRRHLRAMLDTYWDRDWRRHHDGHDESPEDHLWRAATAVTDIWAALEGCKADP
jgi:hypothetical protein